jgi:cation:H+ antiporter
LSDFTFFIIGVAVLWLGAEAFVGASKKIGLRLNLSPLIVGLTLGALGTSAPEILVSWTAAFIGNTDISVGNVVGSNMANIGLALGIGAILFPIPIEADVKKYDFWILLFCTMLFVFFTINSVLGRFEGVILLFVFSLYICSLFKRRKAEPFQKPDSKRERFGLLKELFLFAFGLSALLIGARIVVIKAVSLAVLLGVSETIIGITVVAVGTSLPEIAVLIAGGLRKVPEISLGTIIGSNIFNILLIGGGTALIRAIRLNASEFFIQGPAVLLMSMLIMPSVLLKKEFRRIAGFVMIYAYALYIVLIT